MKAGVGDERPSLGKGLGLQSRGSCPESGPGALGGGGVCVQSRPPTRRGCSFLFFLTGHANGNQGEREQMCLTDGHVCPQQSLEYLLDIFHLRCYSCTVIGSSKFTVSIGRVLCLWAVINRVLHYRSTY